MDAPRHIAFALCPHLPLLAIASALELLRHANRAVGHEAYRWSLVSADDQPVLDTTGLTLAPTCALADLGAVHALYVVAGFGAAELQSPALLRCLRHYAKTRTALGGISNGAYLLARAGLLDGYQSTVHWEDFERFVHDYPAVRARYQRYVVDRQRFSCSGATATFDLFLQRIEVELGKEVALRVSMQLMLHGDPISARGREPAPAFALQLSPRLQRAISAIEASGDAPPSVASLARQLGMSRRSLYSHFQRELGIAPKQVLQRLRLNRVQALLQYSELSLSAIAEATGFSSQSHMGELYKRHFDTTPAAARAASQRPYR